MEFIRQLWALLYADGELTHFLLYAAYAWGVMTPRSVGAGAVYAYQPYRFRLSVGYFIGVGLSVGLVGISAYAWQHGWWERDLARIATVIAIPLCVLTLVPSWGRALIRWAFQRTPYGQHVTELERRGVHIQRKGFEVEWRPEMQLAFITIFNPDLDDLERNLQNIRANFKKTKASFKIMAVIDGKGAYENSDKAIPIAKKYCDVVAAGNAQRKRVNLDWMITRAWNRGWITTENARNVVMHFIDDDTIPSDEQVAARLNQHFANPLIGGVTTAQYVNKPRGFWQHSMQIFESARNYGSQAFLSLFGAVGCLPGRWYAVRGTYITPEFATELSTELIQLPFGWTCFGWLPPRLRDPGDDRLITIQVQRGGGLTIMAPDAVVFTDTPTDFKPLWGMVTRWARSSNLYTIQLTIWMLTTPRMWPTLFLYWGNIGLAFGTVYIAYLYWPYQLLFGDQDVAFLTALAFMVASMTMTMLVRQIAVVAVTPMYGFFMVVLGPLGIMMQTAQVWGMLTYMKSKWTGVRSMGSGVTSDDIDLEQETELG